MTRQTNGTPELKYSEETFRDMYEALKQCRTVIDTLIMNGHINKQSMVLDASYASNAALWALNKAEALTKARGE